MRESIPFEVVSGAPVVVRFKNLDGQDVELRVGLLIFELTDSGDDKDPVRYSFDFQVASKTKNAGSPAVVKLGTKEIKGA